MVTYTCTHSSHINTHLHTLPQVNGERVEMPYTCIRGVRITCERGGRLAVVVDCGLTVKFDTDSNILVRVANDYKLVPRLCAITRLQ